MVAKGQKSPGLGWYSFMGADDQESALGQTVDHVMKGRRLHRIAVPLYAGNKDLAIARAPPSGY
jgi:hypothetical protein